MKTGYNNEGGLGNKGDNNDVVAAWMLDFVRRQVIAESVIPRCQERANILLEKATSTEQEEQSLKKTVATPQDLMILGDMDSTIAPLGYIFCVLMEMCFGLYAYKVQVQQATEQEDICFGQFHLLVDERDGVATLKAWCQ
eukprot:2021106-Rhodomonas_salina.1